jgi:hypothetical protein
MSYGKPEYDPLLDAFECEICHNYFSALARHVKQAHGIPIRDYKRRYGLNYNVSLISPIESEKRRELAKKMGIFRELNKKSPFKFKKGTNKVQNYKRSAQTMKRLSVQLPEFGIQKRREKARAKKLTVQK